MIAQCEAARARRQPRRYGKSAPRGAVRVPECAVIVRRREQQSASAARRYVIFARARMRAFFAHMPRDVYGAIWQQRMLSRVAAARQCHAAML